MTRRALLSLPFVAPLAKSVKPEMWFSPLRPMNELIPIPMSLIDSSLIDRDWIATNERVLHSPIARFPVRLNYVDPRCPKNSIEIVRPEAWKEFIRSEE